MPAEPPLTQRELLLRQAMIADPATYGPLDETQPGGKTDDEIALLFNTPGPGAVNVDLFDVSKEELMSLVVHSEWPLPTTLSLLESYLRTLLSGDRVRVTAQTKAGLLAVFGPGTTTRANLQAAFVRKKTRAESLVGWPNDGPVLAYPEVTRARAFSS